MKATHVGALCACALTLAVSTTANAALVSRLSGAAVYDTDLNITWLADANLAASNTFGVSGIYPAGYMTWASAQSWIGAMNTANYLGYSGWRLPTSDTCSGYNCTGSEMGHLFYTELGGVVGLDITTTHNANYSLFSNLHGGPYWSGTEYAPDTSKAWSFGFGFGTQGASNKSSGFFALVVRSGDVAASASVVPVPAAVWLFGSGLLGLLGVARRRKAV